MPRSTSILRQTIPLLLVAFAPGIDAQQPPYDVFPPADPPYYRVRYEAAAQKGELVYPVNYTIWIPEGVKTLRGVIVHQHGCGENSCKSGLTGAYDLHWQALAKKHDCALLSPSYEQPEKADCQLWCDPRNGSDAAFQKCLVDLAAKSGHPELPKLPWALWGHSGGGHWSGGMTLLHPERVVAVWLRSGVPTVKADPKRATVKVYTLSDAALKVPMMCNLGTKEGVTVKEDRFAGVWPGNEAFFNVVRGKGGLIGVAVDPLTSHECGNQRYLAIPWLDACLSARLPKISGDPLLAMPTAQAWLASVTGGEAMPAAKFAGNPLTAAWLPSEAIAKAWMQYVKDTAVTDLTPPPAPTNLRLKGNELTWNAEADLESGLASFIIERDGKFLAQLPEKGKNPYGRPIFQNNQYSDTPTQPLVPMRYIDMKAEPGKKHTYRVIAVNTVNLKSMPSADSAPVKAPDAGAFGPADWPWWRGPTRDGIANAQQLPPLKWSESENILWKSPVPGRGHGSPIIVGERIFLATADHERDVQSLACYDRGTGKSLWLTAVHKGGFTKGSHVKASNAKSSYASSTPACDGKRVFINFFNVDAVYTTALDLDGKQLWQTKVSGYVMHQGFCSSPMIHESLVLVSTDNKGGGAIAGLDRATGKIVWKHERPKLNSYASPILVDVAGRIQLVLGGCERITSLDPATGVQIWEIPGSTIECVTSTVTDGKNVFISGGWPRSHISAIRGDGSGKIIWENKSHIYVPSMLVAGGYLYAVQDDGIVACWNCDTGKKVWSARFQGPFSASLVLAGERIYATNEAGRTYVFKATPEKFDRLAENKLGDNMMATSVICGGRIYMRVAVQQGGRRQEMLYCVGEAKSSL